MAGLEECGFLIPAGAGRIAGLEEEDPNLEMLVFLKAECLQHHNRKYLQRLKSCESRITFKPEDDFKIFYFIFTTSDPFNDFFTRIAEDYLNIEHGNLFYPENIDKFVNSNPTDPMLLKFQNFLKNNFFRMYCDYSLKNINIYDKVDRKHGIKPDFVNRKNSFLYKYAEKRNNILHKKATKENFIHNEKEIADYLKFSRQSIPNIITGVKIRKIHNSKYYQNDQLCEFISKNSYKYENGVKISPCNHNNSILSNYFKIEEAAEKLGIAKRTLKNKIYETPEKLEGVEILKIGTTYRIEEKSFLRYVETLGGETAK